ncbi:ER membrane glycoprotein subunit of the GPI transamidase complex-like protein [Saitoella coloradoensis]
MMPKPALRPPPPSSSQSPLLRDYATIFTVWALQKLVILALSLTANYSYDTSTTILFDTNSANDWSHLRWLTERYTRWDTLYFTELSRRGNVWEQEWAFGRGWWRLVGVVAEGISPPLTGILLSHLSHLGAVFMLHNLTQSLQFSQQQALLTSLLHALSPAGIFLAAGYTESLFAFLSFAGMLLYTKRTWWADFLAAVVWGYSGTVRSTGIFYAGFWAWKGVVEPVFTLGLGQKGGLVLGRVVWYALLGIIVLAGFGWTQWEAYQTYCPGRPWCDERLPMIYNFVQSHYWDVGFLRYWTLNQVPMWILAGPMLVLSALSTMYYAKYATRKVEVDLELVPFVVLQAFLILAAVTTMHVQIWTRVSSASIPTYWYAADVVLKSLRREVHDDQGSVEGKRTRSRPVVRERHVTDELKPDSKPEVYRRTRSGHVGRRELVGEKRGRGQGVNWGKVIVGFFVGYSWVQALLYSRFLPPA